MHTGLVHNGDCMEQAGFEVGTKSGDIYTAISTDDQTKKQSKLIEVTIYLLVQINLYLLVD